MLALPAIVRAQEKTEISFWFPVAAGMPITKIIDGYAADFQRENPGIGVTPIYTGTYQDTLKKVQTALKAGAGPQMAVLPSTDVFALLDDDLIRPLDTVTKDSADKLWLAGFYPALLKNGQISGHIWSVPFQRSTVVLYWNKAAFQKAGLDPERPPATWQEHANFAAKLTQVKGSKVERWGTQIPNSGFAYWLFQALVAEAGGTLANAAGIVTNFAGTPCLDAIRYWIELNIVYRAQPWGTVEWDTTPRDFLQQKAAMIWSTTGILPDLSVYAKFPFGVAMPPAHQRRGAPTGGGNFYLFKSASEPQRLACLNLLQWITSPERAARWGIATGYIATRPDAWATKTMRDHVAGFPAAAVGRDQLRNAVRSWPRTTTNE